MGEQARRLDEPNMRQLLANHPADPVGAVLRLAWLQGLSREEIAKLTWTQVDFTSGTIFLEDRSIPLDPETAACLEARQARYGSLSAFAVISDKYKEPLRPESISRIARTALDEGTEPGLQLKDLRRDFFYRQLEEHDWPYAVRVSGLTVATFHANFAGARAHQKRPSQALHQFDEFRLWQVLQKESRSAVGLALWMSWQMGVQAKDLVDLTWDRVDLEGGVLRLPERSAEMTNAVRRLLEQERDSRQPGDDPHVLLSPQARRPLDAARLSKVVQTALIRGGLENVTLRDIRAAGELREEERRLLEYARTHGSVSRKDAMALLGLSDTAAYTRLHRLAGRGELEQIGRKYYLPGTVVPEGQQWDAISEYLRQAGFAYCQDIADLLRLGRRKTASILRQMVREGRLTQFEKRYYLVKEGSREQLP